MNEDFVRKEFGLKESKGFAQSKYEESDSLEVLLYWLAYAVLGRSYTIFKNFPIKRRGILVWRILKKVNPKKYYSERRKRDALLFQSISIVLNSLRPIFLKQLSKETVGEIVESVGDLIAHQLSEWWGLPIEEAGNIAFLLKKAIESGEERGEDPMTDDARVLLSIYGDTLTPKQIGNLMKSLLDPWFLIYPRDFVRRYLYLTANNSKNERT